jgi:GT2 family glycosyltransferase
MRGASLPKSTHVPGKKKPLRRRVPGFLGKFLRRCVVRFVGAAVYVIGDLLDIAIGNGLDLASFWPKGLSPDKWPWSQESGFTRKAMSSRQSAAGSSAISDDPVEKFGVLDFLLLTEPSAALKTSGSSPTLSLNASIIIPVFNNADYTFQCIRSLLREVDLQSNEIIIVNNGSTDQTGHLLDRLQGVVAAIHNSTNVGFVQACNQGANLALGKYLVFLNNDTVVKPGWLGNLVATIETNATVGAVGSMLVYPDGRLQEAGGIIWRDGTGCNYGKGRDPQLSIFQYAREVDYCSAASLLVRKDLFQEAGGFDERYAPAYYEDVDLCFTIRSLGFKVIYQPKSMVIHHEGVTAGTDLGSGLKRYQVVNRRKLVDKWGDVLQREHFENSSHNLDIACDRRRGPRIIVSDGMYSSPNHDAGSLRMATIMKILAKKARPLFITVRTGQSPEAESILEREGVEVAYVRDFRNHPSDYKAILKEGSIDLAILSRPVTAAALLPLIRKSKPKTKIIYDTVDIHFLRLEREYKLTGDESVAADAAEQKGVESHLASQSDQVWCVTEDDKKALQNEARNAKIEIVPTIHALHGRRNNFDERHGLLFIGNFGHRPNKDAVHFFINRIYPVIRDSLPGLKFYVVGSYATDEIRAYDSEDVVVMGYVPDIEPLLQGCRVFVAPLRYGAGMKGKIGSALSSGLPVVTTSIGAEGLGINDREHALIADEPEDFARAVIELYGDRELWQRLSDRGYEHIQDNYSPDKVELKILAALQRLGVSGLE